MDGLIAYVLSKKHTDSAIQEILDAGFKVQVEQDRSILSRTGQQMTLYLIPKESSLSTDTYDEYVYTNKWEQIGSTDIDLNYEDLENKPTVKILNSDPMEIKKTLIFQNGFHLDGASDDAIRIGLANIERTKLTWYENYLFGSQIPSDENYTAQYDFNNLYNPNIVGNISYTESGFWRAIGKCCVNTPQIFRDIITDSTRLLIIHYDGVPMNENVHYVLRCVYVQDTQANKMRLFVQLIYYNNKYYDTIVHDVTDWCEIGEKGPKGDPGDDYILTAQDKTEIANIVLGELPTTQGVLYGNTSN